MKFLYGPEKYLIQQKLIELKKNFKNQNPEAEVVDFDLDDNNLTELQDSLLQGQGLFSTKRIVIIKNIFNQNKSEQEKFKDFLQKKKICQDKNSEIIFAETNEKGSKSTSTKLGQYLKRQGEKIEFKKKNDNELQQWINREFLIRSEKKVTAELMAVRELILITRGNLWQLSNEIDKLISYCEQGNILAVDVKKLCSGKIEAKIFDLVDAIGANNKKRSLLLKQQLIDQGDNEFYIFTMVIFQIRNLLKVSECLQKGIKIPALIKQKTGLHPFVIQKTINNLQKYSPAKIKQIYQMVAEIDRRTKIGEMEMERALEWLIVRM
jgi:DNA polymerase-3 subunit delta